MITSLLLVEVELSHLQTDKDRQEVNGILASFISKSLQFLRETLSTFKEVDFTAFGDEETIDRIGLNWAAQKPALIEIGYAFKVAKCFGANISAKEIITKLAKVFNVDITESYIYKKYSEMRMRGRNSRTYFINSLVDSLNSFMSEQDESD